MRKHFLLFYDMCDDYVTKRPAFRDALSDPVDSAVLLFQGDSKAVAERFAERDPYVTNGLVTRWRVREWTTVAGSEPATPVRPAAMG